MLRLTTYSVKNIVESMNSQQFTVQANDWLSAENENVYRENSHFHD